jgi:hypothetical protein
MFKLIDATRTLTVKELPVVCGTWISSLQSLRETSKGKAPGSALLCEHERVSRGGRGGWHGTDH